MMTDPERPTSGRWLVAALAVANAAAVWSLVEAVRAWEAWALYASLLPVVDVAMDIGMSPLSAALSVVALAFATSIAAACRFAVAAGHLARHPSAARRHFILGLVLASAVVMFIASMASTGAQVMLDLFPFAART